MRKLPYRFKSANIAASMLALIGCGALALASVWQGVEENGIVLSLDQERIIGYSSNEGAADAIAALSRRLQSGKARLAFDKDKGYLPAFLKEMNIPVSTQTLVFSKTSSQAPQTTPSTPRALYFNDQVFVGWAKGSPVIDLAAIDPKKGAVFYTLDQTPGRVPKITRRIDCMSCHIGPKTYDVPGLLVRSVFTKQNGMPSGMVQDFVSGHNNPLRQRWGGWYVTGTHGRDTHMGNAIISESELPTTDLAKTSNIVSLKDRVDVANYLSPHSDTVALLVLDHVVRMQVLITRAGYETRYAQDDLANHPGDKRIEAWAKDRIAAAGEALVAYMLFRDEAQLHGRIRGTSGFETEFPKLGPKDSKGRSLREFDLVTRVFKYPCSYLIQSEAFDALPKPMKDYVWGRLQAILTGKERSGLYATMSDSDRRAVLEILLDTKPEFKSWVAANGSLDSKTQAFLGPE